MGRLAHHALEAWNAVSDCVVVARKQCPTFLSMKPKFFFFDGACSLLFVCVEWYTGVAEIDAVTFRLRSSMIVRFTYIYIYCSSDLSSSSEGVHGLAHASFFLNRTVMRASLHE